MFLKLRFGRFWTLKTWAYWTNLTNNNSNNKTINRPYLNFSKSVRFETNAGRGLVYEVILGFFLFQSTRYQSGKWYNAKIIVFETHLNRTLLELRPNIYLLISGENYVKVHIITKRRNFARVNLQESVFVEFCILNQNKRSEDTFFNGKCFK